LLAGLQVRYDQMAREFETEAAELRKRGEPEALKRLAESLMENSVERFEEACHSLAGAVRGGRGNALSKR